MKKMRILVVTAVVAAIIMMVGANYHLAERRLTTTVKMDERPTEAEMDAYIKAHPKKLTVDDPAAKGNVSKASGSWIAESFFYNEKGEVVYRPDITSKELDGHSVPDMGNSPYDSVEESQHH